MKIKENVAVFLGLIFIPTICMANGLIPLVNFFTPGTLLPASMALIGIIFIEAWLLKMFMKEISFVTHLWKSVVVNVLSSAAGSLIIQTIAKGPLFYFNYFSYILPLFGITFVVETIALFILYKIKINLLRSAWVSIRLNFLSYPAVVILSWPLFMALMFSSIAIEAVRVKLWSHSEIITNEKGYIYATEDVYPKNYLKRYNVSTKSWEKFPKIYVDPINYDISGNIFACIVSSNGIERDSMISIFKIPEFVLLVKLPGQGSFKLSKDGKQIALLERLKGIEYPEGGSTVSDGSINSVSIHKTEGKDSIITISAIITDKGIDWSPDNKKLIFVTLSDSIFIRNASNTRELVLSTSLEKSQQLVIYDIFENKKTIIGNGSYPRWSNNGKQIYFIRNGYLYEYNISSNEQQKLFKMPENTSYYLSPTDENIVLMVRTKVPLSYTSQLTIINIKKDKRYIMDSRAVYECGWSY